MNGIWAEPLVSRSLKVLKKGEIPLLSLFTVHFIPVLCFQVELAQQLIYLIDVKHVWVLRLHSTGGELEIFISVANAIQIFLIFICLSLDNYLFLFF